MSYSYLFCFLVAARNSSLSFYRGDIIILDEGHTGQTLHSTGWASGMNERTKQQGTISSRYLYVVPIVYVPTLAKPVANKPRPVLFQSQPPPQPVSLE